MTAETVQAPASARGDLELDDVGVAARDRVQRMLLFAGGIGAVVFAGILTTGASGIISAQQYVTTAYWWATILISLVLPASFTITAYLLPMPVLRTLARVAIYGFVAVYLGYLPSMTVEELPADVSPWLQGITALSSMLAGMLWKGVRVWVYPLVQGLLVASVLTLARPEGSSTAYLEGLGAVLFCAVMAGVAQAVVRGAEKQDLAAARARQQAGLESARRTREREQARIDAVVHDDIMSVLLTAASATPQDGVAEQARQALQSIDSLKQGTRAAADAVYTGAETVAVTLGGLLELSNSVPFGYEIEGSRPVPALVASALSEAATEALRNCLRHAGVGASVSVTMRVTDEAVTVDVSDNGQGFSPDAIPERRLGVRRSIIGRMGAVDGGEATITSAPGDGTLVSLIWTRP